MNGLLEKKEKTKKYFVKDESLHGVDDDKFNYADIAQVLDEVISTNNPPYNIAIIGKWGLGKSSLINLVTEKYKKDQKHYHVQEINAWKYEKESLRKVFLKQLWQGVSQRRIQSFETVRKEVMDIINAEIPVDEQKVKTTTKKFWTTLFGIFIVTILAFIFYKCIQTYQTGASICSVLFWIDVFLRYCKNIGTILIGPALVALFKLMFDEYNARQTKKIELNFPIETTDDYEIFLETKIKDQLKENPDLKIITVIDDLDRLSVDKIVEALDALKAFVGFERCIFIVPFDDEIIKRALDKRRAQDFNEQTIVTEIIESELILDKLFQYKIYLPPILDFDIQQYAYDLAKQAVPDFLNEYCEERMMQKVIMRILIHPDVTTPRQVKKLLNAFINNLMIVTARESSGKIQKGLLTSEAGIMQIAKLSVLQADYNNFYDLLFKDMRCAELLLAAHRGEITKNELPVCLYNYFDEDDSGYFLKSEYESLLNFLSRTAKYQVPSIAPYLYLAQDDISIKTGDELHRRTVNALRSGNVSTLQSLLKESPNLAEAIRNQLTSSNNELEDMLATGIQIFEDITEKHRGNVAQIIIDRTLDIPTANLKFLYHMPAGIILQIFKSGENAAFNAQFLQEYLNVLCEEQYYDENHLCDALMILFANLTSLELLHKEKLREIAGFCLKNNELQPTKMLRFVTPESDEFETYWGLKWFEKLCNYIASDNDFSEEILSMVSRSFSALKNTVPADDLISPVIQLTQYTAFIDTFASMMNQMVNYPKEQLFKAGISNLSATVISENIISMDFEQFGDTICRILDGLNYSVTEINKTDFDQFTSNYSKSDSVDSVLGVCGKNGYFSLLPNTIASLTDTVFTDETCDELLRKVSPYFADEQKSRLGEKINNAVSFNRSRDYKRVLGIIEQLSIIPEYLNQMDSTASIIIANLQSYYSYDNYREFASLAFQQLKESLPQSTIDNYVDVIGSFFGSYPQSCIQAVDRISMKMSASAYKSYFERMIAHTKSSEFESAFNVIIQHNSIRPNDDKNLTNYASFLVNNLPISENPSRILCALRFGFAKIDRLTEMVKNALENPKCSTDELIDTLAHFVNQIDNLSEVAEMYYRLVKSGINGVILSASMKKLENYTHNEIYGDLMNVLDKVTSQEELITFVDMGINDIRTDIAQTFILECLRHSLGKSHFSDSSIRIIDRIAENSNAFKSKKEIATEILQTGFTTTTSDNIKKAILLAVSKLKIKPQFKRGLTGADMDYYTKWIS